MEATVGMLVGRHGLSFVVSALRGRSHGRVRRI